MEHIIKTGLFENEIKGVCKYDEIDQYGLVIATKMSDVIH